MLVVTGRIHAFFLQGLIICGILTPTNKKNNVVHLEYSVLYIFGNCNNSSISLFNFQFSYNSSKCNVIYRDEYEGIYLLLELIVLNTCT